MLKHCQTTYKNRKKYLRLNGSLLVIISFLLVCLFLNTLLTNEQKRLPHISVEKTRQLFLTHVRDIPITNQNNLMNITYNITTSDIIPQWLNEYGIAPFFNYYWLRNGAYVWHLQRLMDFQDTSTRQRTNFSQRFPEDFNQTNIYYHLDGHPEYGIILDSASDPVPLFFPPLPQSSVSFEQTCEHEPWLAKNWSPCQAQSKRISSLSVEPLITYVLYDVTLDVCRSCQHSSTLKPIHYGELIYLFDSVQQITNETYFVRQILPRLVRLLALVPKTAFILIPYLDSKVYIKQYLEILVHRGVVNDWKRFISYNRGQIYHANAMYSTSSPRSDLLLLQQILNIYKPPVRQELILIIRNQLDEYSYNKIVETLHQFEFSNIHIEDYNEGSYNLTKISHLFRQARIVIGMPTDTLSHIVWCLPRTHIIEIVQHTMTTDYYEISLQLRLIYWLVLTTKANQIDRIDFRNIMLKVLADIDA